MVVANLHIICKNCGADKGIHHYKTLQCPVGGVEARVGKEQEWMDIRFEEDNKKEKDIVLGALSSIQKEMVPIEGHSDPGALIDCFNIIRDYIIKS